MGLHRLPLIAVAVLAAPAPALADALAEAAAKQVGVTVIYDPSYVGLDFPGGDVPRDRGVCTDVVIRALRAAHGIDLQLAVNRDMKSDFAAYPALWGLSTTDRNIDHRRVPNLETLLRLIGAAEGPSDDPDDFAPGDIVSWRLAGSGLPHIGIVAETRSADGARPLVTHNIGWGTRTEDILFDHDMVLRARLDEAARVRLRALTQ
ncbi:hypothetical protein FIU85_18625 [Roseovarius sp. THAF8]|uniref:DUF1287 domain-containing protein n=1 Tax=Roseovarius sp. THAF8 TaxID=2587846 RepID=UPI0012686C9E|nr:DUF1287 domain-containing protein [Roseovarius sp. THAF8]QFT99337.1 hypothetical protein FIU85_18625 [Roseovarius sp. THAF8]